MGGARGGFYVRHHCRGHAAAQGTSGGNEPHLRRDVRRRHGRFQRRPGCNGYRQHIDALNAEANRHLAEVQRIEGAKRQLSMSTEDRIREIRRQGMTEYEATRSRWSGLPTWRG